MPVIRKPESTKNRSTPYRPVLNTSTTSRLILSGGGAYSETTHTKWQHITTRIARPRTPSSAGTYERSAVVECVAGAESLSAGIIPSMGMPVARDVIDASSNQLLQPTASQSAALGVIHWPPRPSRLVGSFPNHKIGTAPHLLEHRIRRFSD